MSKTQASIAIGIISLIPCLPLGLWAIIVAVANGLFIYAFLTMKGH